MKIHVADGYKRVHTRNSDYFLNYFTMGVVCFLLCQCVSYYNASTFLLIGDTITDRQTLLF